MCHCTFTSLSGEFSPLKIICASISLFMSGSVVPYDHFFRFALVKTAEFAVPSTFVTISLILHGLVVQLYGVNQKKHLFTFFTYFPVKCCCAMKLKFSAVCVSIKENLGAMVSNTKTEKVIGYIFCTVTQE